MSSAMLLGAVCDRDLKCFLHSPAMSGDADAHRGLLNAMLAAMGVHEYDSASYANKAAPQMEGLCHSVIDGMSRI